MLVIHKARRESGPQLDLFSATGIDLAGEGDYQVDWTWEDVVALKDDLLRKSFAQIGDARVGEDTLEDIEAWAKETEVRPFSFADCISPYASRFGLTLDEAVDAVRERFLGRLQERRGGSVHTNEPLFAQLERRAA